jgi:hypothetical protein
MTHARRSGLIVVSLAIALVTAATAFVGCGRNNPGSTEKSTFPAQAVATPPDAAKLILAGSIPEIPGEQAPVADGFIDSVSWDATLHRLNVRGWAPFDARATTSTLIVRDPFGFVTFATPPVIRSEERGDVSAERANDPALLHSGFNLSLSIGADSAQSPAWEQSLEIYALSADGKLSRLTRTGQPARASWQRRPDCFSLVLVHATPALGEVARKKNGNLDTFAPDPAAAGTVTLTGWANFDGGSPHATLVIQLPPLAAPAAIASYRWMPRPDVMQVVDPSRAELARSGFQIVLSISGQADDLRKPGALRMWSIAPGHPAELVGTGVLRE